ncbi:MAG: DUF1684 domain-containing protein [Acidobacteria bacterium]|nr:DUF1684 domain-containing protein [Acidobacteriota bacterium]
MGTNRNEGRWKRIAGFLLVMLTAATASAQSSRAGDEGEYERSLKRWRAEREAELAAEDGWLAVTGLFWLREGANEFGSSPENKIIVPASRPRLGSFDLRGGSVVLRAVDGAGLTVNGKSATEIELQSDAAGKPDRIRAGDLSFVVLKRGNRFGIRLRDGNSRARREFTGLRWYPVKESYRLTARFIPHDRPREVPIVNILGDVEKYNSPGLLKFTLAGQEHTLEPVISGGDRLFIIFRDLTSNRTTYAAGRFLYADPPKDGQVVLDFNQAINPPCAFTAYATCPLPPRQNRLRATIEAGEMIYRGPEMKTSSAGAR